MRILVDIQGGQTRGSRNRGIGRYTRDLVNALIARGGAPQELYLAWNNLLPPAVDDLSLQWDSSKSVLSAPYGALSRGHYGVGYHDAEEQVNNELFLSNIASTRCRHVILSSIMETDEPDFVLPVNLNFQPMATTYSIVYDIIPYLFKERYFSSPAHEAKYMAHLRVKLSADYILCISEKTRTDIIDYFRLPPEKVVNIGCGIDSLIFKREVPNIEDFPTRHGIIKPYLLFFGGDEYRKNLLGFIEALLVLPTPAINDLQVLIVGKVGEAARAAIQARLAEQGIDHGTVVFAQFLSEDDLLLSYRGCRMTVIPSIYEGFGLPVLEAMACGAPVIASNNTSMAEIIREDAFLFDCLDPADIARAICFVLDNETEVRAFQSKFDSILDDFNWAHVADRVVRTIEADEAKQKSATYVRRPPVERTFSFIGTSKSDWTEYVETAGIDDYVTIRQVRRSALPPLPFPVAKAVVAAEMTHPEVMFVSDAVVLRENLLKSNFSVVSVILDIRAFDDLSYWLGQVRKHQRDAVLIALAGAYGIWVDEAGGLVPVRCHADGMVKLESVEPRVLAEVIADEYRFFDLAAPVRLAARLKRVLRHQRQGGRTRAVAEAAAVSIFEHQAIIPVK